MVLFRDAVILRSLQNHRPELMLLLRNVEALTSVKPCGRSRWSTGNPIVSVRPRASTGGPSNQLRRYKIPDTILAMGFGTLHYRVWVLGITTGTCWKVEEENRNPNFVGVQSTQIQGLQGLESFCIIPRNRNYGLG